MCEPNGFTSFYTSGLKLDFVIVKALYRIKICAPLPMFLEISLLNCPNQALIGSKYIHSLVKFQHKQSNQARSYSGVQGSVTPPPDTNFAISVGKFFYFFVFLEHKKNNWVLGRKGRLVNLLHLSMKSFHVNRYSSIMGITPILAGKMYVLHPSRTGPDSNSYSYPVITEKVRITISRCTLRERTLC